MPAPVYLSAVIFYRWIFKGGIFHNNGLQLQGRVTSCYPKCKGDVAAEEAERRRDWNRIIRVRY